jgi:hypothetical protein
MTRLIKACSPNPDSLQLVDLPNDEQEKVEKELGAPSGLPKIISTGFKVRVPWVAWACALGVCLGCVAYDCGLSVFTLVLPPPPHTHPLPAVAPTNSCGKVYVEKQQSCIGGSGVPVGRTTRAGQNHNTYMRINDVICWEIAYMQLYAVCVCFYEHAFWPTLHITLNPNLNYF